MKEDNFRKTIKELEKAHAEFPTFDIGTVIQTAADRKSGQKNANLHNISGKQMLKSVESFVEDTKKLRNTKKFKRGGL